jgi:poly(3-hydroxybutyrate) depolymerase
LLRPTLLCLGLALCALRASCGEEETGPRTDSDAGSAQDSAAVDGSPADHAPTPSDGPAAAPDKAAVKGPKLLPKASKPCPAITEGQVTFLGVKVRIWVGKKPATTKGPLILYWHGTGTAPTEATFGLGQKNIDAIKAQGGLVAAPKGPTGLAGAKTGGIVWTSGDFALADEIVACALKRVGIDTRRIHSMGMSAGGLHTAQLSYTRAGYLASVTTYSGGLIPILPPPASQDPTNKLPAMIMHGGDKDTMGTFSFKASSERYLKALRGKGHFAFICDHGQGHWLPPGGGAAAWRFFTDHPWGTSPSPYRAGLPSAIPSYCKP